MTDPTWTIEQVIGHNVREARVRLQLSQVELGEQVGTYLVRPWPRQTVSGVEQGNRAFTATEVVSLARVLHTTPTHLFRLPSGVDAVAVGGAEVARRDLQTTAAPNAPAELLLDLMDELRDVAAGVGQAMRVLNSTALKPLDVIDDRVTSLVVSLGGGDDG